jgi:methylated-DNA-protein-cysteine methyltransferase related protein
MQSVPPPPTTYDRIYQIVAQIPRGQVATYGQIAELAGLAGKARLVGYALFRVPLPAEIPWQRVINAQGEISYSLRREGGDYLQRSLLEEEGILFTAQGKIDLKTYRWRPDLTPDLPPDLATDVAANFAADGPTSP